MIDESATACSSNSTRRRRTSAAVHGRDFDRYTSDHTDRVATELFRAHEHLLIPPSKTVRRLCH